MKKRDAQIDAAKGVLILLMLIGHIWTEGWFRTFIYAFHMPACSALLHPGKASVADRLEKDPDLAGAVLLF